MAMSKAQRQEVRLLKRRSERWNKRRVFVEGVKCIQELCTSNWKVERIYFTEPWTDKDFWSSSDAVAAVPRLCVSSKDMEMMSALKAPPGILAVAHLPESFNQPVTTDRLCLYLDGVSDPGNVGTLVRIADWFGLGGVYLSPECADVIGPKALQSAMGSAFHIPCIVCPWSEVPAEQKTHVMGLDASGEDMFQESAATRPSLLVVGSESHGMTLETRESCHRLAAIPGAGRAESLNASVAGAIAVACVVQQGLA